MTWLQATAASESSKEVSQTVPQALFKQSSSLPDLVVEVSLAGISRASPVVQLPKGVESSNHGGSTTNHTFG